MRKAGQNAAKDLGLAAMHLVSESKRIMVRPLPADRGSALRLSSHPHKILAIGALGEFRPERNQLVAVDPAGIIGDFLRAGDPEPLALFERANEFRRLDKAVRGPGV